MADIIKSEIRRRENEDRSRAVFAWHTAYLTGLAVNCPRSFPDSPARAFPFIEGSTAEGAASGKCGGLWSSIIKSINIKPTQQNFSQDAANA